MKRSLIPSLWAVALFTLTLGFSRAAVEPGSGLLPQDACGIWAWYSHGGTPSRWNGEMAANETYPGLRGMPIVVGWDAFEPADGDFQWHLIDEIIDAAVTHDKYVFTLIWLNPTNPAWLFERGVPRVEVDTFKSDPNFAVVPYPLDPKYKFYSERVITALADYLRNLPPEKFARVLFHQVVEGSTGDGFCYKGPPKDPQYAITPAQWAEYQREIRAFTIDAFTHPRAGQPPLNLLIHTENIPDGLRQTPALLLKQGVASHFYHPNDSQTKADIYAPWMTPDNPAGRPIYSRGEGETMRMRQWFQKDPVRNLYWSALYALHCGLDIWNIPDFVLEDASYHVALDTFNRYAGHKDPRDAPRAFCAFKDSLNVDDVRRFPEETYGPYTKDNLARARAIAAAFADRGARMEDPSAVLAASLASRGRTGYNDVGLRRISDYSRYLYPIDANETSVGWWHLGPRDSIYGRFARGFDHASGKDALYLRFHDRFFPTATSPGRLAVRVVWFDHAAGSWQLAYDAGGDELKVAETVRSDGSGVWRELNLELDDAVMRQGGPRGSDLALLNAGQTDLQFHLIEVRRL